MCELFALGSHLKAHVRMCFACGTISFFGYLWVLENQRLLNCGNGLPEIFACVKGASAVHFQDPNEKTAQLGHCPVIKRPSFSGQVF
ncbi:hypothetical protein C5167_030574 [Papaver somniferum]|nr:hypothetical protein C5167_030574 [Papaver somniferum]